MQRNESLRTRTSWYKYTSVSVLLWKWLQLINPYSFAPTTFHDWYALECGLILSWFVTHTHDAEVTSSLNELLYYLKVATTKLWGYFLWVPTYEHNVRTVHQFQILSLTDYSRNNYTLTYNKSCIRLDSYKTDNFTKHRRNTFMFCQRSIYIFGVNKRPCSPRTSENLQSD